MTSASLVRPLAIEQLVVEHVRNLQHVELNPGPQINLIVGANGAGKTSLLEAIFILGRGRSFRSRRSNDWIQRGAEAARIIAQTSTTSSETINNSRLGLERDRQGWQARINGEPAAGFAVLSRQLPLVMFEPNSHELISGSPEQRRAFIDWGVFHVEPDYVKSWRRYHRALRQRNAALREQAGQRMMDSLIPGLTSAAEQLDRHRLIFFTQLQQAYSRLYEKLAPDVPEANLVYQRGWEAENSLAETLKADLPRDREAGYTRHGPHRADIGVLHQQRQMRGWLSRGQQKLVALLLLLAQQETWTTHTGRTPIILLDDLYSELDANHSRKVLNLLQQTGAQTWITTTTQPDDMQTPLCVFHVEQGQLTPVE